MADNLNATQVGGSHYHLNGVTVADIVAYAEALGIDTIQHWDLAVLYKWDPYQYQITKYTMRWKDKKGLEDVNKIVHFAQKYVSVVAGDKCPPEWGWPRNPAAQTVIFTKAQTEELMNMWRDEVKPGSVVRMPQDTLDNTNFNDLLNPSAWIGFTFEGVDANGQLHKCTKCGEHFHMPVGRVPARFHTCSTGADPTGTYVHQDSGPDYYRM